jgi:hypothetical protein
VPAKAQTVRARAARREMIFFMGVRKIATEARRASSRAARRQTLWASRWQHSS